MSAMPDGKAEEPAVASGGRWKRRALLLLAALAGVAGLAVLVVFGLRWTGVIKPPVPTPACVEPVLTLGAAKFRIRSIARAADASVSVPRDTPDVAYWVEGTNINYVFALSPSADSLALKDTLKVGEEAVITWADCMADAYQVEAIESGPLDLAALTDQATGGLTVFVQAGSADTGLVVHAIRPVPEAVETPALTEEGAIQADIAFSETTTSADGKTISMGLTITNVGATAFAIAPGDISLTPEGGEPLAPLSVEPALPQGVQPGASVALQITFPRPGTNVAVLKILDTTVEQYF